MYDSWVMKRVGGKNGIAAKADARSRRAKGSQGREVAVPMQAGLAESLDVAKTRPQRLEESLHAAAAESQHERERPKMKSRVRVLEAALELFGSKGFADTSVRELAARAGVNLATMNYYFGSKENLRVEALRYGFSPTSISAHKVHALLFVARRDGTIEAAEKALEGYIHIFVKEVVGPEHKHWGMFLRERMCPGPAFKMVMREYFEPLGSALGGILTLLLPDAPPEKIQFCISSILGQCVHIRISAPTIKFFRGQDPASPEFLDKAAIHIAEFSMQAVRGLRQSQPAVSPH